MPCWTLALQEYDISIVYRKGAHNSNADALSRCEPSTVQAAVTMTSQEAMLEELQRAQHINPIIKQIMDALRTSTKHPRS